PLKADLRGHARFPPYSSTVFGDGACPPRFWERASTWCVSEWSICRIGPDTRHPPPGLIPWGPPAGGGVRPLDPRKGSRSRGNGEGPKAPFDRAFVRRGKQPPAGPRNGPRRRRALGSHHGGADHLSRPEGPALHSPGALSR